MRVFTRSLAVLVLALSVFDLAPRRAGAEETLLLQQPSISRGHVVFVYANDLWIVERRGGEARRLTSDQGVETRPSLSPDGQWVAFSAQYDGNTDVYLLSIDGGTPRRLTWHPGADLVQGWNPDGQHILFSSSRASLAPVRQSFLVHRDGGTPDALAIPRVSHATYHASGKKIAYTPYADAFRTWKRYRGGRVTRIWIYDPRTHEVEVVPHVNASDTFPAFVGDTLYFASDRDDQMNLYKYQLGSGEPPRQITFFQDFDVRSLSSGGDAVVIEQAGAIHVYDPATNRLERLAIHVTADGLHKRPRWQEVRRHVRNASIAPNGKRAVFEARGEIVSVPREHGDSRNLSRSPGVHDRDPAWSPDGKQIAWFADTDGEYRLHVGDHRGRDGVKTYDLGGGGFYHDPRWSPDGKHILFRDKSNRTAFVTLETGEVVPVVRNQGSLGVVSTQASWSPDSQWIAFELRNERTMYDRIALYSLKDKTTTVITDDFGATGNPTFSRDGKHLYFVASVNVGPRLFGLDMNSSASRNSNSNLYVAVLKADGKNPLAPKSDEGFEEKKGDKTKKGDEEEEKEKEDGDEEKQEEEETEKEKEKEEEEEKGPSIDLEGLDQRILALPVPSGNFRSLGSTDKGLLFVEFRREQGPVLKSFSFDSKKTKTVAEGVSGFEVSADGKSLLTSGRGGSYQIMDASGGKKKSLDINSFRVRVDPAVEWPQILRETWRLERDYFYDHRMHGVDWDAMWERWKAFLPHVAHRSDLNLLIAELIGELACGHNYVGGGESPRPNAGPGVGLLGADYDVHEGRYRISRIYRGQNWNPGLRAPLTAPGVSARVGDSLISVNGREVTASDNLYAAFVDTDGKQVDIVLSASADGGDPRTSTVVPIGSEGGLRRLAWVEANRKRVDELSGGRLAYIYMPNTGGGGLASFDRDYYSQLDKEGLVLDERFNGGGWVADYVIHVLGRKRLCYWMNREQWVAQSPFGMFEGPKAMVINERAGSGGDCMPWMFRNEGLGPLVGRRTWGGLVGISGYPPLMDGGRVTAASFGVMDKEGNWAVENEGVAPDFEVTQWPKDVIAGRDPQLEKAVELVLKKISETPRRPRPVYSPPAAR